MTTQLFTITSYRPSSTAIHMPLLERTGYSMDDVSNSGKYRVTPNVSTRRIPVRTYSGRPVKARRLDLHANPSIRRLRLSFRRSFRSVKRMRRATLLLKRLSMQAGTENSVAVDQMDFESDDDENEYSDENQSSDYNHVR